MRSKQITSQSEEVSENPSAWKIKTMNAQRILWIDSLSILLLSIALENKLWCISLDKYYYMGRSYIVIL